MFLFHETLKQIVQTNAIMEQLKTFWVELLIFESGPPPDPNPGSVSGDSLAMANERFDPFYPECAVNTGTDLHPIHNPGSLMPRWCLLVFLAVCLLPCCVLSFGM